MQNPMASFVPKVHERVVVAVRLTMARLFLFASIVGFEAAGDEVVGGDGGSASDLWHKRFERLGSCVSVDGCEHGWSGDVVGVREKGSCSVSVRGTDRTDAEEGNAEGISKGHKRAVGRGVPVACANPNRFTPTVTLAFVHPSSPKSNCRLFTVLQLTHFSSTQPITHYSPIYYPLSHNQQHTNR